ncbi:MAG: hypothetical protein ACKVWR_09375 [Acidimicrobiales bacterium]
MDGQTILVTSSELAAPIPDPTGRPERGDLTPELLAASMWSDELVAGAGIPIRDTPLGTVGGGIGSFVLVDTLRIAGLAPEAIRVFTTLDEPWQTYEYLTRVSQIPREERLRSDSGGTPDNIWGWPGYALREAWADRTLAPVWSVLTEPIFTDYWTPKAGQAFTTMAREAARIRYAESVVKGQVRVVRRRLGGGYFVLLTPPPGTAPTKRVAWRCRFVHLAVGYPGLRFLPDLQEYKQRFQDYRHVVNAYEPHEHVYEELRRRPGVVLLRGGGIVASRILQRLMEDRWNHGAQTTILHLFRTYVHGTHGEAPFWRRRGGNGWAYQGFNWPKGAWGGQLKDAFERLEGEERAALYRKLGGTHTPRRKLWQQQMARARAEGWYHTLHGVVEQVQPAPSNQVGTVIKAANGSQANVAADFVIDATGLEGDLRDHRLLADLLDHGGAGRNPLGRLDVERSFEVRGARSDPGRLYASGSMTLGGYYAGVDSFLGLQYAALAIADDLAAQRFCPRIGVSRSIQQWWRWAANKAV